MASTCSGVLDISFVDLGYTKVAALGVLQGITELLPVSSTAHVRIVPALFGWRDPGSAFSAAMQLAALAAVMSYFWTDVKGLVFGSTEALARRDFTDKHLRMAIFIGLATVPIGIAGIALSGLLNQCNSPLRSLSVIGWACLGMAACLAVAEYLAQHRRIMQQASLSDALIVGVAQMGALTPGVSRSGSTLTAALALGFRREEAARFSFLLGLPAIALAGVKELWELHKAHLDALVHPRNGLDRCVAFGIRRDMGIDENSGALLVVAFRRVPRATRRVHSLGSLCRLAPMNRLSVTAFDRSGWSARDMKVVEVAR